MLVVEESNGVLDVEPGLLLLLLKEPFRIGIARPVDDRLEVFRRVLIGKQIAQIDLEPALFLIELGIEFEKLHELRLAVLRAILVERNNHVEEEEAADAAGVALVAVAHFEKVLQGQDEMPQAGPVFLGLLADLDVTSIDRRAASTVVKLDSGDGFLHLDDWHSAML